MPGIRCFTKSPVEDNFFENSHLRILHHKNYSVYLLPFW